MSMNDYSRTEDIPVTEQEGVMFGATPVWDRGKKRRGFGRKASSGAAAIAAPTVKPEARSFAAERDDDTPMALDRPVDRAMDRATLNRRMDRTDASTAYAMGAAAATPSTLAAEESDAGLVAPIGRPVSRTERTTRSHGIAPVAVAAGAVGLVALGAAGWFATRSNEGVPELTPGAPAGSQIAAAPLPPVDTTAGEPGLTAQNILPPRAPAATPAATTPATPAPEAPRQMARAERRAPVARTRPAAAGADTTGMNVSATAAIPAGPQPYSALNPGAAPRTVNPAATPAPPTTAAQPMPSTPPVITPEPSPTPAPQDTAAPAAVTPQ